MIQHHVWMVLQVIGQTTVWPLLAYEGEETEAKYRDAEIPRIIKELREAKSNVNIIFRQTSDLLSLWTLLGMKRGRKRAKDEMRSPCPFCTTADLSTAGQARTAFDSALINITDPMQEIIPCLLHAKLRIADHRLRAIRARAKRTLREKGHTEADALRLLDSLGCKQWSTSTRGIWCWQTAADADRLEESEKELAKWEFGEGVSPWPSVYAVLHHLERGISEDEDESFAAAAQAAGAGFMAVYGNGAIKIYEHIILFHGLTLSQRLVANGKRVPLGSLSNQRTEAEHSVNKRAMQRHTFKNGTRRNSATANLAVEELLVRSLMIKHLQTK